MDRETTSRSPARYRSLSVLCLRSIVCGDETAEEQIAFAVEVLTESLTSLSLLYLCGVLCDDANVEEQIAFAIDVVTESLTSLFLPVSPRYSMR
jgi:hypothetical protein